MPIAVILLASALLASGATVVDEQLISRLQVASTNNASLNLAARTAVFLESGTNEFRFSIPVTEQGSIVLKVDRGKPDSRAAIKNLNRAIMKDAAAVHRRDLAVSLIEIARLQAVTRLQQEDLVWRDILIATTEDQTRSSEIRQDLMQLQNDRDIGRNRLITLTNRIEIAKQRLRRLLVPNPANLKTAEWQLPRPAKPLVFGSAIVALASDNNPQVRIALAESRLAAAGMARDSAAHRRRGYLDSRVAEIRSRLPEQILELLTDIDALEREARSLRDERLIRSEESLATKFRAYAAGKYTLPNLILDRRKLVAENLAHVAAIATQHQRIAELVYLCGAESHAQLRDLITRSTP